MFANEIEIRVLQDQKGETSISTTKSKRVKLRKAQAQLSAKQISQGQKIRMKHEIIGCRNSEYNVYGFCPGNPSLSWERQRELQEYKKKHRFPENRTSKDNSCLPKKVAQFLKLTLKITQELILEPQPLRSRSQSPQEFFTNAILYVSKGFLGGKKINNFQVHPGTTE